MSEVVRRWITPSEDDPSKPEPGYFTFVSGAAFDDVAADNVLLAARVAALTAERDAATNRIKQLEAVRDDQANRIVAMRERAKIAEAEARDWKTASEQWPRNDENARKEAASLRETVGRVAKLPARWRRERERGSMHAPISDLESALQPATGAGCDCGCHVYPYKSPPCCACCPEMPPVAFTRSTGPVYVEERGKEHPARGRRQFDPAARLFGDDTGHGRRKQQGDRRGASR